MPPESPSKSYCVLRSDRRTSRVKQAQDPKCHRAQLKSRPESLVIHEKRPTSGRAQVAPMPPAQAVGSTRQQPREQDYDDKTPRRPRDDASSQCARPDPLTQHDSQSPSRAPPPPPRGAECARSARTNPTSRQLNIFHRKRQADWVDQLALALALLLASQLAGWLLTPASSSGRPFALPTAAAQQYKPEWPQKIIEQEIFLLNLEDGYFGCQVNTSQDFLQLFELSRLCDGQPQCYLGSDELAGQLKCRDRDHCETYNSTSGQQDQVKCVNGVCLDGLCYCNDGFGGKSCDIPDENECKFRPCDVFAHCTNTMGSYYCSCFPGYDGDGMHCQDINECEIPSLRALCSDNSECVNLPGHFVCKCKPGYQQSGLSQSTLTGAPIGNATVQCADIDECSVSGSCGKGALCENLPGSYRCACPPGFSGDPSVECIDMDECRNNPCGLGAQCTNIPGGYRCSCAPGHERNPNAPANMLFGTVQFSEVSPAQLAELSNSSLIACLDVNECLLQAPSGKPACGAGAQCVNTQGGYFCQCPPGFSGNPKVACVDIDECAEHACGPNAECQNLPGGYRCECKAGYTGNAYHSAGCQDEDECLRRDACGENAQCFNTLGSHQCSCLSGFAGDPLKKCLDIDECAGQPCGPGAQCRNLEGGYRCTCPEKYLSRGTPEMGCERAAVNIGCSADTDCSDNAQCVNATCQCKLGYQISGIECVDVDECSASGPQQQQQQQAGTTLAPIKAFTRLSALSAQAGNSSAPSAVCGPEAGCQNTAGSYRCDCKPGYEKIDPLSATSKCRDTNECEAAKSPCGSNSRCFNTEGSFKCLCNDGFIPIDQEPANGCKSPCDGVNCGQHATCKPHGEEAACVCKPGFTFDPSNIKLGCVDINECDTNYGPSGLCGQRAVCTNTPGSYACSCPSGYAGDAFRYCEDINECDRKFGVFGQCGELAVCTNKPGSFSCACAPGYTGDPRTKCADVDECSSKFGPSGKCGLNAQCTNLPGKFACACPPGFSGDPNVKCTPELPPCATSADCPTNQACQSGRCVCPFSQQASADGAQLECRHPCDKTECGAHATCQLDSDNQPLCVCDAGFMAPSDGRSGCVDVNECIQGVTLSGTTPVSALSSGSGGIALGPASSTATPGGNSTGGHPCGRNALCRNQPGSFDCICPAGYSGDAYVACTMDVRNQQMVTTTTTSAQQQAMTTTTSSEESTSSGGSNGGLYGNYQQEPRTTACSEPCPRGHVCADGKCVKRDSCRDNQDCRASQACQHMNQALGFQCVNVCDAQLNQCGPNARCLPHNHKPICACDSAAGYAGNPYDLVSGCRLLPVDPQQQQQQQQQSTSGPQVSITSSISGDQKYSQTKQQDQLDAQRATTQSQQGDISTFSFGYGETAPGANQRQQQVPTSPTRLTTITTSNNLSGSSAADEQLQRQQAAEQQQQQQPVFSYELPLPTTPILPHFESTPAAVAFGGASKTTISQQMMTGFEQQQQQQQGRNLTNKQEQQAETPITQQPQFTPTQSQQQTTTSMGGSSTTSQQQTSTTTSGQSAFTTNKRKQSGQLTGSSERHEGDNQDMQTTKSGPLVSGGATSEQRTQQQQMVDEIAQAFSQFQNKSGLSKTGGHQLAHKHVACTSDQHCPGNLLCLSSGESTANFELAPASHHAKTCGCPADLRREGDFCFMQRVNCTSSAHCKPREECVPSSLVRQQQQQPYAQSGAISQQFALSGTDDFGNPLMLPASAMAGGLCVCPRGYKLTLSGLACVDRNECDEGAPCALGAICQNKIGSYECVCPPGTLGEPYTKTCEPIVRDECQINAHCPQDRECDLATRRCVSPCHVCGPRAICTAANHAAICLCPPRYTGNAIDQIYGCQEPLTTTTGAVAASVTPAPASRLSQTTTLVPSTPAAARQPLSTAAPNAVGVPVTTLLPSVASTNSKGGPSSSSTMAPLDSTTVDQPEYRTIPPTELFVMCLADGIHVDLQLERFDGIIYVKGHSQDPKCRKLVMSNGSPNQMVDFKVQFGHCDLIHRDGEAGFVLVIQKHPKLVTYRARAYHVKCVYNTGERTVTLGFNVSMITTSGTIANTGPPPTCLMSITALDGREVTSAEIGQDLLLRVDVQPDAIYGGFARSCEAKTMDDEGEYQYEVTDANGCATDPSIFSDWKYDLERKSLVARFNAFKFPSSNNLRFQCNIRVCFGSCPAVNCNGVDAYGKRRRRRDVAALAGSNSSSAPAEPDEELVLADAYKEGALREEIMVQSNAILTFDKKEPSLAQQQQVRPPVDEIEFVCLPRLGVVMSIALTTLLALLALAVATSCWCFAKKKRHAGAHKSGGRGPLGPLPHPMDFPNPLMRAASSSSTLRESLYGP